MPENNPRPGPENELDPGASTQMFQAFVERHESEEPATPRTRTALVVGAVLALIIVLVLVWLVVGN
ncbi:hypothetical protein MU582_00615 [Nocardioidaceae bacterium SCSIO 66511]|nr:hypothetical protein MU582_00615 [Nocardioidaceae bacterium SCSIO 66511]